MDVICSQEISILRNAEEHECDSEQEKDSNQ